MIHFFKMLDYDLRNKADSFNFGWVCEVTLQNEDPGSLNPGGLKEVEDANIIFHSPLRRVVQCLPEISADKRITVESLREIKFNLRDFCTEKELLEKGSEIVRRQFKRFFIQDRLSSSREQIFNEVREVLRLCVESRFPKVAVVSHSFRLQIIEAFIKTAGSLESNPSFIEDFIFDDIKRFDFGEGFTVEHAQIAESIS